MKPICLFFTFSFLSHFCIASNSPQNIQLFCPRDTTITCTQLHYNLDYYGVAMVQKDTQYYYAPKPTVKKELNSCGWGTIYRTWRIEDANWNWISCTQIIHVTNENEFTYDDITWPDHLTINACNPDLSPEKLGTPYDRPRYTTEVCSQPMYNYKDQVVVVSNTCKKIIREWKVLDWCVYEVGFNKGVYTYTQIIKVIQDEKPIITALKDTVVENNAFCDSIFIQFPLATAVNNCGSVLPVRNNSKFSVIKEADASGKYPIGTSYFVYKVEYACGAEEVCSVRVVVKNLVPPTPYCHTGIITTLMPVDRDGDGNIDDGMIDVWAKDLDAGAFHTCKGVDFDFSFSKDPNDKSRTFTCKDLGDNLVEIWHTDENGNQTVCKTIVTIQNNNPNIPNCKNFTGKKSYIAKHSFSEIESGSLLEAMDERIINGSESGKIKLYHISGKLVKSLDSNDLNNYNFDGVVPQGAYLLIGEKDTKPRMVFIK